jgi:hypothetical protein
MFFRFRDVFPAGGFGFSSNSSFCLTISPVSINHFVDMQSKMKTVLLSLLVLLMPLSAFAQTLDEAARNAARQYNAKVLSAHTEQQGNKKVHVIKLITKDSVVKTVRVTVKEKG